jgi:hypothetical protein
MLIYLSLNITIMLQSHNDILYKFSFTEEFVTEGVDTLLTMIRKVTITHYCTILYVVRVPILLLICTCLFAAV